MQRLDRGPLPTKRILPVLAALLIVLVFGAVNAHANVVAASSGEPAFTKGTTNTWFFTWSNPGSSDYWICFQLSDNGASVWTENSHCFDKGNALSGTQSEQVTGLQSGHQYTMEAHSYYLIAGGIYGSLDTDAAQSTTIDNSTPSVGTGVDGTGAYTNNPHLTLHISYSDSTSPEWYWASASSYSTSSSTWDCFNLGSQCTPTLTNTYYDPGCSVKDGASFSGLANSSDCTANWTGGDGKVYYCAREPDSAFPDNPSGADQITGAQASNFNVSAVTAGSCGYITLDRVAPTVSVTPSATSVTTGTLVNFGSSATDAVSGVPGATTWDFGDGSAHASGATASHTYSQPGTYVVKASAVDGAGNTGQGTTTINVTAPPSGGGTNTGSGGTNTGSGGTTTTGGGGTTTTGGGGTVTPGTVTSQQISNSAGGGGTQHSAVGALSVIAPKRFTAGKRTLILAGTTTGAGKASIAVLKGSKIVARKGVTFGGAGTFPIKVRMPKKLKAGKYKIKVSFTPAGSATGKTKSLNLRVVAAKKKRRKHAKMAVTHGVPVASMSRPVHR